MALACLLCESKNLNRHYQSPKLDLFWLCQECGFIFRDPKQWLSHEAESERYKVHQNSVESKGYQNFLMPVVESIQEFQNQSQLGLDYGCGPQSVIQYLLKEKGFNLDVWDPQFHPLPKPLVKAYDYVSCTEVIEHFRDPITELKKIIGLLKPNGKIYLKTAWTDRVVEFSNWHYQRDPTHVGFFGRRSFEFLCQKLNLKIIKLEEICTVLQEY